MATKSFLEFVETTNIVPHHKTRKFLVRNIRLGQEVIGWIEWRTGWRRYTFVTSGMLALDSQCLTEIAAKLDVLMQDRQAQKLR